MKERKVVLAIAFLLTLSFAANLPLAAAQPSVQLQVTRVYWGQAGANPGEAHPGDTDTPLTVEVFNNSNETIRGIQGLLKLQAPITNYDGKYNATVSAVPVEQSLIGGRNDTVLPLGSFTFTYSLTIDSKAEPRAYTFDMIVTYYVKNESIYLAGSPQALSVTLIVDKTPTTITCTVTPQRVDKDGAIEASGSVTPSQDNVTVLLNFRDPTQMTTNISTRTRPDGSYRISFKPNIVGTWSVNASWSGDQFNEESWVVTTFEVTEKVQITVQPSRNYLTADRDVTVDLNLTNSGGMPLSTVNVALTVPQPLLLYGDNSWSISYLGLGNSTVISVRLYAPANVIGSTFTATMTLTYRDTRGGSYTQTYLLALVVRGYITMVTYDRASNPSPVEPGKTITLSGTILNKGNINAMYVNATILPNPRLIQTSGSTSYLGQIDENSPVPFTLTATVSSDAGDGTYTATVKITYQDDQQVEHSFNVSIDFAVQKTSMSTNPGTGQDLIALLRSLWWMIALIGATTFTVVVLYWRRIVKIRKA